VEGEGDWDGRGGELGWRVSRGKKGYGRERQRGIHRRIKRGGRGVGKGET